jgi:hypothetical protein
MAGFCEHGINLRVPKKCRELPGYLRNYWLLKKDTDACI